MQTHCQHWFVRWGCVFIRTHQTSPFLRFYKEWPGRDTEPAGALEAVTAITIEISYWGQVMRTNRLGDGSISDIDTRRGRTNCDISFLFHVQRELSRQVALCVRVLMCTCVKHRCEKLLDYKMHHDTDVKDSASTQREILIESLPPMLTVDNSASDGQ